MKTGKILIVMIFAALGFSVNAQRGVQVNSGNYSSVRQYIHVLDLSPSQVREWDELNRYYEDEFYYVRYDRQLSSRAKTRKLEKLYYKRDNDLRNILSNYQYKKFKSLRSYNSYNRPTTTYSRRNYYNNTGRRYGNRGYGSNYSCRTY